MILTDVSKGCRLSIERVRDINRALDVSTGVYSPSLLV